MSEILTGSTALLSALLAELTNLQSELSTIREKTIEECAKVADDFLINNFLKSHDYIKGFHEGQNSTATCIARDIRALSNRGKE